MIHITMAISKKAPIYGMSITAVLLHTLKSEQIVLGEIILRNFQDFLQNMNGDTLFVGVEFK